MNYISLKEARTLFLFEPTRQAINRWVNIGLIGLDEQGRESRVRLKVHYEGGRICTTPEWVAEFKQATSVSLRRLVVRKRSGK